MIKYVLCVAVDKEHKNVVLIHKLKPEFQKGKLNCPGGKIENDDYNVVNCRLNTINSRDFDGWAGQMSASREFFEETSIESEFDIWHHVITLYSGDLNRYGDKDIWEMYIHFTDQLDITKVKTMEAEKIEIFPINNLPDNIMPNLKWIIPLCLDGKFKEVIEIWER